MRLAISITLAAFFVACGGVVSDPPPDCSAAKCLLTSTETGLPLPSPPIVYSCSVSLPECSADYNRLCLEEAPFHGVCKP